MWVGLLVLLDEVLKHAAILLIDLLHLIDVLSHSLHATQGLCHNTAKRGVRMCVLG